MHVCKKTTILLAGILGICSAFISRRNVYAGTTYYVVTDGAAGYLYVSVKPTMLCGSPSYGSFSPYCTVQTKGGYVPVANTPIPVVNLASYSNSGKIYQ